MKTLVAIEVTKRKPLPGSSYAALRYAKNTWDVYMLSALGRTQLGNITRDDDAARDDRWVPRAEDHSSPLTWCPTRIKAIKTLMTSTLLYFPEVTAEFCGRTYEFKRIEF